MKTAYTILYFLSGMIFFISLLGSSIFKPMFESISEKTLSLTGFNKDYLVAMDDRIDELIYKSKQIELQIEKIKKFFSSEKVDESLYTKEKSELLEKTFYNPVITMFIWVYRILFFFIALIILSFAVIFQIGFRSYELRKRVRRLEEKVLARV